MPSPSASARLEQSRDPGRFRLGGLFVAILAALLAGCGRTPVSPSVEESVPGAPSLAEPLAPDLPEPGTYDAVHPSHVLAAGVPRDIPAEVREELGLVAIAQYRELGFTKYRSELGLSSSEIREALALTLPERAVLPDLEMVAPESRSMSVAFNDGSATSDDFAGQGFLEQLRVEQAHESRRGKKIKVAVIDTGIDRDHPAVDKRYKKGHDFLDGDKHPWEEADGVDDDLDGLVDEAFGHGTHIAALVALMAPKSEIYVYRVLSAEGRGAASDVAAAVLKAVKDKVHVINLSLGMYADYEPLRLAVEHAEDKGVVVVASIGNDGVDDLPQYPAAYPQVIAVGSVDSEDRFSTFSNYDAYLDAVAPGENILSAAPNDGWAVWSGTSMSTAIVTGLAAVLAEEHKKKLRYTRLRQIVNASGASVFELPAGLTATRVDFDAALRVETP